MKTFVAAMGAIAGGLIGLHGSSTLAAESAPARGLSCDNSLKAEFRPDPETRVVLVRQFRKGEALALAKDDPARSPRANADVCLVKLIVGPGNPGPAGAPSTSQGIGIEVWLPAHDRWNERIHAMGGGGFQGGYAASLENIGAAHVVNVATDEGAVTSTTDTGHASETNLMAGNARGDFALNPDRSLNAALMRDFSVRAIHKQAVKTKALTAAFYGRPARWAYWEGGSTGGRQGHKLAQAHPEDFDGIIANYPALYWDRLAGSGLYPQIVIQRDLGGKPLTEAQLDLVSNAAIAACDVVGGEHLGYLIDPSECRYDPVKDRAVLCRSDGGSNDAPDCVTRVQAQAVNKMWYGPTTDGSVPDPAVDNGWSPLSGKRLWYGFTRGTSLWNWYFTKNFGFPAGVANPGAGFSIGSDTLAIAAGDPALAHPGFKNASGDGEDRWRDLSYAQFAHLMQRAKALDATFLNLATDSADLSAFKRRGGKMLVWHAYNDEVIAPQSTIKYYESVLAKMGGAEQVQSFYRLYMVPGNGHMSPNGTSNQSANPPVIPQGRFYQVLTDWVEKGIAPGQIEMISPGDKPVRRSQPACAWPAKLVYRAGSANDAASYDCAMAR